MPIFLQIVENTLFYEFQRSKNIQNFELRCVGTSHAFAPLCVLMIMHVSTSLEIITKFMLMIMNVCALRGYYRMIMCNNYFRW
jgi:hypothetical protein